ncbi:MAG: phage holin [Oscillospiraceae bacterium]|nr:phage holin [Oscillospiraceae bacterium]
MPLSNTTYDILSKIQRWLPALGAFYLGLCKVWGFLYGSEVNETIALIATLLAATLEISTARYYKAEK